VNDRDYRPLAREDDLLFETLEHELLVCDVRADAAHVLNETAAKVWRACDGQRDVRALQEECGLDEDTVLFSLDCLAKCDLLEETPGVSRRVLIRRTAIATAGLGAALPVISSLALPTPAMAQSLPLVTTTTVTSTTTSTTTGTTTTTTTGTTTTTTSTTSTTTGTSTTSTTTFTSTTTLLNLP
jgi:Coenzyme PQQ synthesis protein D (PqqD)